MEHLKNIAQKLNIPQREIDKVLRDSFYVVINDHYTATVRSLWSFIDFIQRNPNDIGENFGAIRKEARMKLDTPRMGTNGLEYDRIEDSNFYHYLLEIIGYVKGFAVFNHNRHQFVQLNDTNETVSIRTKDGKLITVAVLEGAGCADISLHNSGLEPMSNGSRPVPVFELTGLDCGGTPVPKAKMTIGVLHLGTPISSQKPN